MQAIHTVVTAYPHHLLYDYGICQADRLLYDAVFAVIIHPLLDVKPCTIPLLACRIWYVRICSPLVSTLKPHTVARSSILATLEDAVKTGFLEVEDSEGTYCFGVQGKGGNGVRMRVLNDNFWMRVFL